MRFDCSSPDGPQKSQDSEKNDLVAIWKIFLFLNLLKNLPKISSRTGIAMQTQWVKMKI